MRRSFPVIRHTFGPSHPIFSRTGFGLPVQRPTVSNLLFCFACHFPSFFLTLAFLNPFTACQSPIVLLFLQPSNTKPSHPPLRVVMSFFAKTVMSILQTCLFFFEGGFPLFAFLEVMGMDVEFPFAPVTFSALRGTQDFAWSNIPFFVANPPGNRLLSKVFSFIHMFFNFNLPSPCLYQNPRGDSPVLTEP